MHTHVHVHMHTHKHTYTPILTHMQDMCKDHTVLFSKADLDQSYDALNPYAMSRQDSQASFMTREVRFVSVCMCVCVCVCEIDLARASCK
jgi:hypothetical protein